MSGNNFILEIKNLELSARESSGFQPLLSGVSLRIRQGEIVALAGATGAGKSLTARSILRLLDERNMRLSGQIIYEGRDLLRLSSDEMRAIRAREIALMFQDPLAGFNPLRSIGSQMKEVVLLDPSISKSRAKERVLELIREMGLDDADRFYNARPSTVSGGELQRLMFAISIAAKPRLLLLDEPGSALDPVLQQHFIQLIRKKASEFDMSVLIITHDLKELARIAGRVWIMNAGSIVEEGTISYLKNQSLSPISTGLFEAMQLPVAKPVQKPAPGTMPVLKVEGLEAGYYDTRGKERVVIRDVHLELYSGQCIGITGPSGAGKSTLALAIPGLTDILRGKLLLEGKDLRKLEGKALRKHRKKIQIVWQNPLASLHPYHSVRQSLKEALRHRPPEAPPVTLEELLAMVKLPETLLDRKPHQLSGGQQQRLSIATALSLNPRVLICDEAVSALDTITQKHILELLKSLQERLGLALLFISHDENAVSYMTADVMRFGD